MSARAAIVEMIEAGLSAAQIAWHARCDVGEVQALMASVPRPAVELGVARLAARDWSEGEDAIVDEGRLRDLDARAIRQALIEEGYRRPTRSVGLRMRTLAERARSREARRTR